MTPTPDEAEALAAERAKLGVHAEARIKAVGDFIAASSSPGQARAIMSGVVTAAQVEGFEKLMAHARAMRLATPAPSSPPPSDPDFDASGKVSDGGWSKMSHAERLDYCRQFPQSQFEDHRGRR